MTDNSLNIDHLSKLARIQLTEDEKRGLSKDLPAIVDFFSQIEQVGKEQVETSEVLVGSDQLRTDELGSGPASLSLEELEKLAPKWQSDQVVVPAVFGNQENA